MHACMHVFVTAECMSIIIGFLVSSPLLCGLGKPLCRLLTERERDLFAASSITLPQSQVTVYNKLYLKKTGRVVCGEKGSRSILRDNSGVIYQATTEYHYGKLLMAFVIEADDNLCYAVVAPLPRSGERICKDSMTDAKLDDHLISLVSPR